MLQLTIWKFILQNLENKIPAMLLYVLESSGSSPGRQGFFMAVNEQGQMEGSVGGGIMEYKFVEMAKEKLKQGGLQAALRKQIHDKSAPADQSGMICSGEQTIFLYPLRFTDAPAARQLIASLENYSNGTLELSPKGLKFSAAVPPNHFEFHFQSEDDWVYREKTGYQNKLFIIGGGHCALALSKLVSGMDFYITLYEEREGLNTVEKNEFAHEINIIDDYTALSQLIPSGPSQYVVIMTVGYRTDDIALRSLLGKTFSYLGVLGSKKKMEKLFADYLGSGIDRSLLDTIHTPVGLDINSRTPEEIAISIAAQIIQVKNHKAES